MSDPAEHLRNPDAERAVIGCLLIDPATAEPHVKRLTADMFTDRTARAFMHAYVETGSTDILELATHAAEANGGDVAAMLGAGAGFEAQVPSALNVESYAELVQSAARKRRTVDVLGKAAGRVLQGADPGAALLWANDQLRGQGGVDERDIAAVVTAHYDEVETYHNDPLPDGAVRGLSTGLADLDRITGGLEPSLILTGARPSVGKTALWSQITAHVAREVPGEALYFTTEMTDVQLLSRVACSQAQVSRLKMRQGRLDSDEQARYFAALGDLQESNLHLIYARRLQDIVSRCYQSPGASLIVVDYLNKLAGGQGENRNQRFGNVSAVLFDLAYDLQAPLALLCQLNRDLSRRGTDALPQMEDLRDSGELEQNADVILMLHRTDSEPTVLQIIKRKDRLGGGQHSAATFYFDYYARVSPATRYNAGQRVQVGA